MSCQNASFSSVVRLPYLHREFVPAGTIHNACLPFVRTGMRPMPVARGIWLRLERLELAVKRPMTSRRPILLRRALPIPPRGPTGAAYDALAMLNIDPATGSEWHEMRERSLGDGTLRTDVARETTDDE